jgi:sugar lactone lactonase YvrE
MSDIQCVLRAGALIGERPGWNVADGNLYWVDMKACLLHAFDPVSRHDQVWGLPGWVGTYAFAEDGRVLVALRTGLFALDLSTAALSFVAPPPYDPRRFCFNDGNCDRQGRFHVGPTYAPLGPGDQRPDAPTTGPVWRYDGQADWRAVTPPVSLSNGLAWSPDGRTMYHSDTLKKTIWALDYDPATGEAENQRVFAEVDQGGDDGGPDGACVDRDGFYICAVFGAGRLLRFDPDGRLERTIETPPQYPTMPALGGEDLSTLYFTSGCFPIPADERAAHPGDGALYALEAPAPGLLESLFRFPQQASPP